MYTQQLTSFEKEFALYVRDRPDKVMSDETVIREAFDENTYALHPDHFNNTGIFIDIGANIGTVSLLAVAMGAKKVEAYEPELDNFKMLRQHVVVNKLEDVINTHRKAVWSSSTTIELVSLQGDSTSDFLKRIEFPDRVILVPTVTLADVLRPYEDIDVMKVDTEGAEYEMFRDREVNKKIKMIVMEYHETEAAKFGKLLALLSLTHNLSVFGHYDDGGGQICARRY